MSQSKYLVILERGPGGWSAYVPDLPGCVAAGQSREEVLELIAGAIPMHLAGLREDGLPVPVPTAVGAEMVAV